MFGSPKVVKQLLKNGASLHANMNGETPIMAAITSQMNMSEQLENRFLECLDVINKISPEQV